MSFSSKEIVPLSQMRARLTELCEQVRAGSEKIITRNGEGYVALIDARRLDHYRRLEREHIHLLLLSEASSALDDLAENRVTSLQTLRKKYGR